MKDRFAAEEAAQRTVIIERESSGGMIAVLVALIALVAAIGYFLFAADVRDQQNADAINGAARTVSESARSIDQSISAAAERLAEQE